ncbi:Oidioi.mRNA.OKI2018_I69.XSR.g15427.t1.cds [Oikopleura dioica]|uniref:Oidioi.mRNA.OKI2018_I69.XSR.g15427.t1.cds n=1 Tax=Oikopleura dioica TaxID=34765 RepID=A0ABN7SGU5_OIKDI|nr:Oidioi.mRNA.OKI2018_I69.XSR.g15427.t1.cds [Oikopleura dioica]
MDKTLNALEQDPKCVGWMICNLEHGTIISSNGTLDNAQDIANTMARVFYPMQAQRSTPKLHFFTDDGEVFSYLMRGQIVVVQRVGNRNLYLESEELTPSPSDA